MRWCCLILLSVSLSAHTVDISGLGTGMTSVAGEWKFHPGDDRRWAEPDFDDSAWVSVKVPLDLNRQGYRNFSGYGWYRLQLTRDHRNAPARELQLVLQSVGNVATFYANGALIGSFGKLPPYPHIFWGRPMSFAIPASAWKDDQLLFAVRFWADPDVRPRGAGLTNEAGHSILPAIATPSVASDFIAAREQEADLRRLPIQIAKAAGLLLSFYLIGLYLTESRRPEYLWLGLYFALDSLILFRDWIAAETFLIEYSLFQTVSLLLSALMIILSFNGIWSVFGVRVNRWLQAFLLVFFVDTIAPVVARWMGLHLPFWHTDGLFLYLIALFTLITFLVYQGVVSRDERRWLAISFLPFFIFQVLRSSGRFFPVLRVFSAEDGLGLLAPTTNIFAVAGVGFVLMRRAGRDKAEGDRLHSEMAAAREIQKMMLPAQSVTVPHLSLDSAYFPAQEVSGDFYQFASEADGTLLMLVGDVSGKGLRAALTMSLIVGFWQKLVCDVNSPGQILQELNELLRVRLQDGFATCLCVRIDPAGIVTIANAGHLAPYLNGREMVLTNGLPLGVDAAGEYNELQQSLSSSDILCFVSDGVVEARDKAHNLFGFHRLEQALAEKLTPEAIARRARQFGQEDDITVIAVRMQQTSTPSDHVQPIAVTV